MAERGGRSSREGAYVPGSSSRTREAPLDIEAGGDLADTLMTGGDMPSFEASPQQINTLAGYIAVVYEYADVENDEEMRDFAKTMRTRADGIIPSHIQDQYRLGDIPMVEDKRNFLGKARDSALSAAFGDNPVGRVTTKVLDYADRVSQGVLTSAALLQAGQRHSQDDAGSNALAALGRGLTFQSQPDDLYQDPDSYFSIDQDGDGIINFREAFGYDADAGGDSNMGLVVGAADQIGVALFDPLTYTGIGPAARARAGLASVAATQGDDVMRRVAREGIHFLDDRALREIEDHAVRAVTEAADKGRRNPGWMQRTLAGGTDEAVRKADVGSRLGAIDSGVGTLSFAGKNIPIKPLDAAVNKLRRNKVGEVSRLGETVRSVTQNMDLGAAKRMFGDGVDAVEETAGGARLTGRILNDAGESIGTFTTKVLNDGTAIIDDMAIDAAQQGKGGMSTWLDKTVSALEEQGVTTIRGTAKGDGAMVWGRRGFDIDVDSPDYEFWKTQVLRRIDEELAPVDPTMGLDAKGAAKAGAADDAARAIDPEDHWEIKELREEIAAGTVDPGDFDILKGIIDDVPGWPMIRDLNANTALRASTSTTKAGRAFARLTKPARSVGRGFKDAITPRATLARLSKYGEEVFDTLRVRAGASIDNEISDMLRRLDPVMRRAAKEQGKGGLEAADDLIRNALEVRPVATTVKDAPLGSVDDLSDELLLKAEVEELRAAGMPATATYLEVVGDIRSKIDAAAVKGGLDVESLRRSYFPRTLTDEGRDAVSNSSAAQDALGLKGLNDGERIGGKEAKFHEARKFMADDTVEDANREMVKLINKDKPLDAHDRLPDDTIIFEESVANAFATRGDAAFRAAAQYDMLEGLAKEMVGTGDTRRAMVVRIEPGATPPSGYKPVNEISGTYAALDDVADAIDNVRGWMTSDDALNKMSEIMGEWSSIWGMYATSPLLDGLGFHSRNAMGNVLLNAIGGVVNPNAYRRAQSIQQDMGKAFRHMKKTGDDFDTALEATVKDPQKRKLIQGIRENDIVGGGWFDTIGADDFKPEQVRRRARGGKGRRLKDENHKIYDRLASNAVIKSGRALGSAIEHNARIAHYITKLDAPGGTVASAASSTRTYLFDYGDLTPFERNLRHTSRFYTFMRKNAGAQMTALAQHPGRVLAVERATKGGLGDILGVEGMVRPDYSEDRGDTLRLDSLFGGGDGVPLAGAIETPFGAFTDMLRPIGEAAALLTGGGSGDDMIDSLMDLTAGGPVSLIETLFSQRAEHDFFLDREFDETQKGTESRSRAWVESFIGPAWSQLDSFVGRLTEGEGVQSVGGVDVSNTLGVFGNNASATTEEYGWELAVYSNLLGLNAAKLRTDEEEAKSEYFLLVNELEGLLTKLRTDGKDVPTITEMREDGLIPEAIDRAGSVVSQERIDQLDPEDDGYEEDLARMEGELSTRRSVERESGYQIDETTGAYTTRSGRAHDLADTLGSYVLDDDGQPKLNAAGERTTSLSAAVKATYTQQNPGDPFLNSDGEPYGIRDVPVQWPTAREGEVLDWLREVGATFNGQPISDRRTSITQAMRDAYNQAHPQRPQLTPRQRIEAGIRPTVGVYEVWDGDTKLGEIWPEGQDENNWDAFPGSGASAFG